MNLSSSMIRIRMRWLVHLDAWAEHLARRPIQVNFRFIRSTLGVELSPRRKRWCREPRRRTPGNPRNWEQKSRFMTRTLRAVLAIAVPTIGLVSLQPPLAVAEGPYTQIRIRPGNGRGRRRGVFRLLAKWSGARPHDHGASSPRGYGRHMQGPDLQCHFLRLKSGTVKTR
jgi:hypothetical protein